MVSTFRRTCRYFRLTHYLADFAFSSPDVLWACHSSGTFSQTDLREVRKPLNAIPSVAATWEVTGSLAFVNHPNDVQEIPYDERNAKLGDPVYFPGRQSVGTWNSLTDDDLDAFELLARRYVFEGKERRILCEQNGNVRGNH